MNNTKQNTLLDYDLFLSGVQELLTIPEDYLTVSLIEFTIDKSRNFDSINIEDLCYSINHYYHIHRKKIILISDFNESFETSFITKVLEIVSCMKDKYHFNNEQFMLGSGALPVIENYLSYNKLCRLNNFDLFPVLFYNTFEMRMMVHVFQNDLLKQTYEDIPKEKKILFLNGQGRSHRGLLLGKLGKNDLLKYCEYSYHENITNLKDRYYQFEPEDPYFITQFNEVLPYVKDIKNKFLTIGRGERHKQHNISIEDIMLFKKTYISLIAETVYYKREYLNQTAHSTHMDNIFLTEKTYRAIACRHPFILATRPYTLKALRDMGYETFSPFIDESYDNIQDDYDRLDRITQIIKDMCSKDEKYWVDLYEKILPIVEHNFQHLANKKSKTLMGK